MLQLLLSGQIAAFSLLLVILVFSLTLHEFGHAAAAKMLGDDTAERLGRLTLNPFAHIDPTGLLMVVLIGFGYAKPVPMNTRALPHVWMRAVVAGAGPLMNFLLALLAVNAVVWAEASATIRVADAMLIALSFVAKINLLLCLFNLLPLGALDGHYVLSWLLPGAWRGRFEYFNDHYGSRLFIVLIVLSLLGLPIFNGLMTISARMVPYMIWVH